MRRLILLFSVAAGAACHRGGSDEMFMPPATMSDGNIVAIILAANNTDLAYARLAPARARSETVRAFAARMTTDHTILNNRVMQIAEKNGLLAEDHPASLDFRDRSAARRDILRELEGQAFDSTYAANEIQYHTELLAAINTALIPNARNAELREFVMQIKPAVEGHMMHAEQMRAAVAARK